ncbi:MAG: hypothetical protein E4G93_00120 [Dehalococcoidia bacterium]|nr:MAG: hypothetical protein E4G93_00120 [Dehalococcoidia bacterium]
MTQLDPSVQVRLIDATLNLLGGPHVRLRGEDHAKKFILSFRYMYCGLSAAVAKGEIHAEGDVEECFQKLPLPRNVKSVSLPTT